MARSNPASILGARIRARREALGWSQAKLAEAVGLTPNYLGSLERAEALPTVQTLLVLSTALESSPGELLGNGGEREQWLDQLVAIAATVPVGHREILLNVARALAGPRSPRRKEPATARSNPSAAATGGAMKRR
jgi:transcriptional regulator with XRE-family HTH domain